MWKCVSPTGSFSCKSNSFSEERFCTRTCETEAQGNALLTNTQYTRAEAAVSCTRMHCIDLSEDLNQLMRIKTTPGPSLEIFLIYLKILKAVIKRHAQQTVIRTI